MASMATAGINLPRWTPSQGSPRLPCGVHKTQLKKDDKQKDGIESHNDISSDVDCFFPSSSSSLSPQLGASASGPIYNGPLFQEDTEIKNNTREMRTMTLLPTQEMNETMMLPTKEEVKWDKWDAVGLGSEEPGVFLTWEDLWVTVSNRKVGCRGILKGLTGYAQAGEVLAIMGPSGCGKSTLLDALAVSRGYVLGDDVYKIGWKISIKVGPKKVGDDVLTTRGYGIVIL